MVEREPAQGMSDTPRPESAGPECFQADRHGLHQIVMTVDERKLKSRMTAPAIPCGDGEGVHIAHIPVRPVRRPLIWLLSLPLPRHWLFASFRSVPSAMRHCFGCGVILRVLAMIVFIAGTLSVIPRLTGTAKFRI
jgi:hypothetical protein